MKTIIIFASLFVMGFLVWRRRSIYLKAMERIPDNRSQKIESKKGNPAWSMHGWKLPLELKKELGEMALILDQASYSGNLTQLYQKYPDLAEKIVAMNS